MVAARLYPPGESDFSPELRAALAYRDKSPTFEAGRRQDIDLVFLAATNTTGKLIYPQLRFYGAGDLPTYSTSAIWEDGDDDANDLNGISFPGRPMDDRARQSQRDAEIAAGTLLGTAVAGHCRACMRWVTTPGSCCPRFADNPYRGRSAMVKLQGVTGTLQADSMGRIHRRLLWATMRGGQPTPAVLPAGEIPAGIPQPLSPDNTVARHLEHGRNAEQLAARYLIRQGLILVTSNHRARVGELDLVMRDGRILVIVEVRVAHRHGGQHRQATIDRHKQRRIILATQHFILRNRQYREWPLRFDVVGVTGALDAAQISWIRAAFTLDDMASR